MLLEELRGIGRDPVTGGVTRLAWTRDDLELHAWFAARATAAGLDVETDGNGNVWAWWHPELPGAALVLGSHLDSVPSGGEWDGPLGVVSALAAVERLVASGAVPTRAVAVVAFRDEEGGRFGVACLGSRLLTGAIDPARALALLDADGTSLAEAMAAAGHDARRAGADRARLDRIGEFVELHVEQGHLPIAGGAHAGVAGLAAAGRPLGVASEIWPHGRWRLELRGQGNHAGTTPLADRRDPVLAMADGIRAVREAAEELGVLGTVGRVRIVPGAVNAIASSASAWIDARGEDPDRVRELVARVERSLAGSDAAAHEESWTAATRFDAELTAAVQRAIEPVAGDAPVLPSGAGHDAGILASAGVSVAMLFVRNPTGISHAPEELAEESDAALGIDALCAVVEARAL